MEAYLDLIGQTKDVRLQALLQKTDACLQALSQRLLPKPTSQAEPLGPGQTCCLGACAHARQGRSGHIFCGSQKRLLSPHPGLLEG